MIFSKISIGIFLLRIIVEKLHLWLIYVALFINVLSGLAFFLVTLLQCHPVSYFWNKNQDGACISVDIIVALTYVYSCFNIICDFTFALLPIVIVQGLNMNKRLKIAIIPLLGMGCIASSAVVVRLAYVERFRDKEFLCKPISSPPPLPPTFVTSPSLLFDLVRLSYLPNQFPPPPIPSNSTTAMLT